MGKVATEATLREGVDLLHVLVKGQVYTSWGQIQEVVKCGLAQQYFKIGDQLEVFEFVEVARKLGQTLVDEKAEMEKRNAAQNAAQNVEVQE